jgi:hypothetical protein
MSPPGKRQQMVLAQRVKFDIAEKHDLIVPFAKHRLQVLARVLIESGHEFRIRAGDAVRRLEQTLALGVLPDSQQDLPHSSLDAGEIDASRLRWRCIAGVVLTNGSTIVHAKSL